MMLVFQIIGFVYFKNYIPFFETPTTNKLVVYRDLKWLMEEARVAFDRFREKLQLS